MKLKPDQWTHHHTHRLYHISLGLCFGFISIVLLGGMTTALFKATADDNLPKSGNITIGATVAGVNPGPINGGGTSGSRPPVATVNPTVSIVAEPQGEILQRGDVYLFNTTRPAFSGESSVPNGLVFLTIGGSATLNSTAQADVNGNWYWMSPDELPAGNYTIRAAVFDSYDLTRSGSVTARFNIALDDKPQPPTDPQTNNNTNKPNNNSNSNSNTNTGTIPLEPTTPLEPPTGPTENILFGAFLKVLPEYKSVEMGKKVVVSVSLISNTGTQVNNQDISFQVLSPSGKVILQTIDSVSFSQHSEYFKTFYIAPSTPVGEYTILISAVHNGIESKASDTFTVKTETTSVAAPTTSVISQWPALVWALLIMLLLLFIILTIMAYHQIRHHSKELSAQQS